MSELKRLLRLRPITNDVAVRILDRHHPLGAGHAFAFALGIFWRERCNGVMTFGNPISNLAHRSIGVDSRECLELRKMWLSDVPPRNAESRCLAIAANIVARNYPHIAALLTYCDEAEKATSYRACGWIPQASHKYVSEVMINGQWMSIRNANRKGLAKQATDTKIQSRRKFVLPLHASVAERLKRSASSGEMTAAARSGRSNSNGESNRPSRPETANGETGRILPSSQAKAPGSATQHDADSSDGRQGRQSSTSTTQSAIPVGKSPNGFLAAQINSGPRCDVGQERTSIDLVPAAINEAQG